jgi:hypothetical protein
MEKKHEDHGSMRMLTSPNSARCMMVRVIVHNLPTNSIMESSKDRWFHLSPPLWTREAANPTFGFQSTAVPLAGRIDLCRPTCCYRRRCRWIPCRRTVSATELLPDAAFTISRFVMRFAALGLGSIGMGSLPKAKRPDTQQPFARKEQKKLLSLCLIFSMGLFARLVSHLQRKVLYART